MELRKLKISNFKCIQSVELELSDVNILVGVNGSGKSSIIQAIHLACCVIRQAESVQSSKTSTVGIEDLDYLPTDNYKMLGFRSIWGNRQGTSSSQVELTFLSEENQVTASCELRSARNAGISITGEIPTALTNTLRRKRNFFSAYIPGISGIPNREESKGKKVILKACSYGDSNIILRNVLFLLKEEESNNIIAIEEWISLIIAPIKIAIDYDSEKDLNIKCEVQINSDVRPLELIGTGYLQLIQIFSYILLFNPGILLIDEPDIHLHPTVQEKLVQVLSRVASERGIKILLTTHSPFIVRGAPTSAKVYWINEGVTVSENRNQVELALGWGAFGKKIIIITEDANTELLRKIIAQWAELDKFITFYPGTGYKELPKPEQAEQIKDALGDKYKIFIHRDRDSLTDNEVVTIQQKYRDKDIYLWFPAFSDIEAYFCKEDFLQDFIRCSEVEAQNYIGDILMTRASDIASQFARQRTAHNEELYSSGGSPTNNDVWNEFQSRFLKGAKGKFVFKQLKDKISGGRFDQTKIVQHSLGVEIATDLKQELEQVLAS